MPLYQYECKTCKKKWEEFRTIITRNTFNKCRRCGDGGKLVMKASQVSTFKPLHMTNLDVEPVFVESKKQLKEECKKRGVMSAYLM